MVADVRILHISWEFPPLVYGGLGRHVDALARAQVAAGDEVVVITQTEGSASRDEVHGTTVIRRPRKDPALAFSEENLLAWVAGLEEPLAEAAQDLSRQWRPDVVHAHDWMVAHAAGAAAQLFPAALVTTVHATEAGRHSGWLPNELSRSLHSVEWWLTHCSQRVITCSRSMKREVEQLFDLDPERVIAVPNGIDLAEWRTTPAARRRARARHAGEGPLLVHTGRLEWEKGLHTLLDAMPTLRRRLPGVRLVVAGRGSKEGEVKAQAKRLRLGRSVEFLGWLPEDELHALVAAADVAVVPSRYEPFGLVALEAAALGTPVVVSACGGLAEIADDGRMALTFPPGDHKALAAAVCDAVRDTAASRRRAGHAEQRLREVYPWRRVAALTREVYEAAVADWADRGAPEVTVPPAPPAGSQLISGSG